MPTPPRCCLAALVALLCGCHVIFPFDPSGASIDLGVAVDDADVTKEDLSSPDGAPADTAPPDTAPPDAPPPDAAPPDATPPLPCSALGQAITVPTWTATKMMLCKQIASSPLTQCQAGTLCNSTGGWSLCTPTDYRKHGGTLPGSTTMAWLAGCVRENGKSSVAPKDPSCGTCNNAGATPTATSWKCNGGLLAKTTYPFMGLRTHTACSRVGINDSSTEAFWLAVSSYTSNLGGAVCCHP